MTFGSIGTPCGRCVGTFGNDFVRPWKSFGDHAQTYPKQTPGIAPGKAQNLSTHLTAILFNMLPNVGSGSQIALESDLRGASSYVCGWVGGWGTETHVYMSFHSGQVLHQHLGAHVFSYRFHGPNGILCQVGPECIS